jgi:2-polyprenyl-6-methoxyphenol hydroxylase-like FAD-dependent oxidoreductase
MLDAGAIPVESGWDIATRLPHGWAQRGHTGLWQLYASRPLIEATVRQLCQRLGNVAFLERTEVTGLRVAGETHRYCSGVEVRSRGDGAIRAIDADLVVDASGAHSKAAEWLRQRGLNSPEDEIVDGLTGYSSRWFRQKDWPSEWWWKVLFLRMMTPDYPYLVAFCPTEDQRWVLSYVGVNKQYPPSREDEFAAALTTLVSPIIREMVRHMEPISPIYSSRATQNRWRHYERLRQPLGRFIAIADAACSYNPRFAQGMSTAAVCARILEHCLVEYGAANPRLTERFFLAQARFQTTPWLFAAGDDLRFPVTQGKRSWSVQLYNWYRLNATRCADKRVGARLAEVTQLVKPRSSLFAPRIASSVALSTIQRQFDQLARRRSNGVALMPPGVH